MNALQNKLKNFHLFQRLYFSKINLEFSFLMSLKASIATSSRFALKCMIKYGRIRQASLFLKSFNLQLQTKVIHPKYYKYLKEVALAQPFGKVQNGLVSGRLAGIHQVTIHYMPEGKVSVQSTWEVWIHITLWQT